MTPLARYQAAHRQNFMREYPAAYKDGHYFAPKMLDIKTTNGAQRYIVNVLNWLGHFGERINSMGIPQRDDRGQPVIDHRTGKQKYNRPGSTSGSADIHGHINIPSQRFPVPIKIEFKKIYTHGRDTVDKAQQRYGELITRSGGIYVVVSSVEEFWVYYDGWMKL